MTSFQKDLVTLTRGMKWTQDQGVSPQLGLAKGEGGTVKSELPTERSCLWAPRFGKFSLINSSLGSHPCAPAPAY